MSRLAQTVQAMTDELRKAAKKKGRTMTTNGSDYDDPLDLSNDLGGDFGNTDTAADASAFVGIEPDAAPAGDTMKTSKAKAAKAAKRATTKAKAPAAAKKAAPAKATKAKIAKAAKSAKTAKTAKAVKPAKAAAPPKLIIGGLPSLHDLSTLKSITGGERNQFVNLEFSNGHGFKLWPSGYASAEDRIKARDLMVAWLSKALL